MFKLAFSTVACPDRTLAEAFALASEAGYDGIELRTLGGNDPTLLCEPAMTGTEKIRRLAVSTGVEIACLSTSHRFDAPVWPPILGRALPSFAHRARPAQRDVEAADDMECPMVRVFAFEVGSRESRKGALRRISDRLRLVLDSARARKLRLAIENGGSFTTSEHMLELFEACEQHPNLRASYDTSVGAASGESLASALKTLGNRVELVRLRPTNDQGMPRPLSVADAHSFVPALQDAAYRSWVSVDWPVCWMPELTQTHGPAAKVLANAAEALRTALPRPRMAFSPRVAIGA